MARIDFPSNPSNGQTLTVTIAGANTVYTYNSTYGVWRSKGTATTISSGGGASVTTSNTAPSSPSSGDLWWNSMDGNMYVYYNDGDSNQWVQSNPAQPGPTGSGGGGGASVTSYANTSAFPSSGNSVGDFAFATNTKTVYIWDGSEWDRIAAGVDESPVIITEPPSTVTLDGNGSNSTVTMLATDPEGFDITYGIAYKNAGSTLPPQLLQAPVINQSNGQYTFIPSSNTNLAGAFRARLSASDGARTTTRFVDFTLAFALPVTYLVVGGGGSGGSGVSGGGGGAGGLLYGNTNLSSNYTIQIKVGAGGASTPTSGDNQGNNGANSAIIDASYGAGTILALGGGGGGGGGANNPGKDGGSGGGGTGYDNTGSVQGPGGANTTWEGVFYETPPIQGNDGGTGTYNGSGWGGGGGGAGEPGWSYNTSTVSEGGDGLYYSITGSNTAYAGGGGGGGYNAVGKAGGVGGGGTGGYRYGNATDGTDGTGGGGGGTGQGRASGAGGSGIVIISAAASQSATITGGGTASLVGSTRVWTFTSDGTITFT